MVELAATTPAHPRILLLFHQGRKQQCQARLQLAYHTKPNASLHRQIWRRNERTNNILCLLSFPRERKRNCEEPVKGQARWLGSLRSPLTEPSQFQPIPQLWKRKKKIKISVIQRFSSKGVGMCAQFQPTDPDASSTQSPVYAERPTWLTAGEAAQYLNVKVRTILLWARQGKVKAYALTGAQRRVWWFLQTDLEAMMPQKKPVVSSAQPSVLANERRI